MSYKVKKGDTLSKIAKQHGLTLDELMKLNDISKDTADKISIGQELKISNNLKDKIYYQNPVMKYSSTQKQEQSLPIPYASNYNEKQYFKDNAKNIQQQLKNAGYDLGKFGVDGKWGQKSQTAFDQALKDGYIFDNKNGKLYKEQKPTLKQRSSTAAYQYSVNPMFGTSINSPKQSNTAGLHGTSNNPISAAVEDLSVSSINNVYRWITGNDDYILSSRDITEIPEDQKQVLRQLYNYKGGKGNIPWTSADYKKYQGTYTGGNRSLAERAFAPIGAIEHTLGQLNFTEDPDTGDVYMQDTYDWNTGQSSQNQGWYTIARDFMGKFGTKDTDPDGQKRHYKVNLGNPKNWKL